LQEQGHVFRNRCDTEAIIHAWESWGPDCLRHLSGMFAFALWDRNQEMLFLARDRLGKKPLYYTQGPDGGLFFASELGAFAEIPALRRRIDPISVDDFFSYGYVPDPRTIYTDIHKLPAAHYLLVRRGSGKGLTPQRYWSLRATRRETTEAEAAPILLDRLRDSVAARLIADVPLGAFLSGGVDSSAVVALAAGLRRSPLATFTIGFAGDQDERPYADQVARRYATRHRWDASAVDYVEAARQQARIFGEPFGDASSVPTYTVCALTRRHVTVALSGDGGDEVLGGYRRYRWHVLADAVRRWVPGPLRRRVIGELARAYPKLDRAPRWLRAKHTLSEISLDSALGYFRTVCKTQDERRRALLAPDLATNLDGYDPAHRIGELMAASESEEPLTQAQYVDVHTYLVGDILTKVDRTSMANGLEVRAPMLDHEFVEWGVCLPSSLKLHARQGKYLLKRAMEPHLPREILYRRKQGFAQSLAAELRQRSGLLRERLLGPAMLDSGLFQPAALARLLDEHAAGGSDHSGVLWLLLAFEGFLADAARHPALPPAPALAGTAVDA
ncbi:MAG: asparagine synthase (glutamine-hydrolyzing), partial [Acetobacteraceae bacterium]